MSVEDDVLELQRQVKVLQDTIAMWRLNGLAVLDTANLYGGSGGLYGVGKPAARVDHTH